MTNLKITAFGVAAFGLSACVTTESFEGVRGFQGPNDYIAVAGDLGRDAGGNFSDNAGIAVTPDGCQAWIIDDGLEGRASNRLDPVSGLPVCIGEPGVVYGPYQSGSPGIPDYVPGEPVPVRVETVPVQPYSGQYQAVHR